MKAFVIVSKKSGNIVQYEEICNMLCIFPDRNTAEICLRKYDVGEFKRKWWEVLKESKSKWEIREVDITLTK